VRLLGRLAPSGTAAPPPPELADGLAGWLGWTDAIALSAALDGPPGESPAQPAAAPRTPSRAPAEPPDDEAGRLRGLLRHAITTDPVLSGAPAAPATRLARSASPAAVAAAAQAAAEPPPEFAVYRQRYLARQQAMETAIGASRGGLRTALAARSPALARLAAVDAVMEQALAPREQALLAAVPGRLQKHFERLRREAGPEAPPVDWLPQFRRDVQALLLAELDVRLQPLEGLVQALQPSPSPAFGPPVNP